MTQNPLRAIVPQRPSDQAFEQYQVTAAFYREVEQRQDFAEYCAWYTEVAQAHQRELVQLKREVNLFVWLGLWRA